MTPPLPQSGSVHQLGARSEGWFPLTEIPTDDPDWGANGLTDYFTAAGGFDDSEDLLDKIPGVTPLRATGLELLIGRTVCAVVYDSDISIKYDPLNGSLKGDNLGTVAFEVVSVTERTDGSSSSLPEVEIQILSAETVCEDLALFTEAAPSSSSDPPDVGDVDVQAEVGLRARSPPSRGTTLVMRPPCEPAKWGMRAGLR